VFCISIPTILIFWFFSFSSGKEQVIDSVIELKTDRVLKIERSALAGCIKNTFDSTKELAGKGFSKKTEKL